MRVRMPKFDFANSSGRWAPHALEMGHLLNSNSVVVPHLERFLNRVMARARAEISGTDPESARIRADISTFMKQESCHYTIHGAFNDMMLRSGYDGLPELEKGIAAHYERLLATKSLSFLVAYCEGFESLTPPIAQSWFDGSMDWVMRDAEPNTANMWRWHVMEEFEHRTVCHDTFKAIHGGYWLRLYAWVYQLYSLASMTNRVFRYLMSVDRQGMSPAQLAKSKKRARLASLGFFMPILKGARLILRPGYSPRSVAEPKGWAATRDMLEAEWITPGAQAPAA